MDRTNGLYNKMENEIDKYIYIIVLHINVIVLCIYVRIILPVCIYDVQYTGGVKEVDIFCMQFELFIVTLKSILCCYVSVK